MAAEQLDTTWMWHPSFTEERSDTAGLFVHFRRDVVLGEEIPQHSRVHITADTRYKLYVNSRLVCSGPVKGDMSLWFYDEVDIAPYLRPGVNHLRVLVLRFFYATPYACSFPRGPVGGLRVTPADPGSAESLANQVQSSPEWETAVDRFAILRVDEPEDDFLHMYERVISNDGRGLEWVAAKMLKFQKSTGVSAPWHLSARLIPPMRLQRVRFYSIHNIESALPQAKWETLLQDGTDSSGKALRHGIVLPAGSRHRIDLEAPHHMTAFLTFRFGRTSSKGSVLRVRYAESYEDSPVLVPYLRRKDNRCDYSKRLFGPQDVYEMSGTVSTERLHHYEDEDLEEIYSPFHFRAFRFLQITLDVGPSDLVFDGIDVEQATYPLDVRARLDIPGPNDTPRQLWSTSVRTLANCMHDTYEDCPFYEQLQYAMDTRSSILFTYYTSGDDRLARQAMMQLRNSFQASIGLTSSRAPSHKPQIIPHFSLFWIATLADHWTFFGDATFLAPFAPIVDAVLCYFHSRLDPATGLVTSDETSGYWNFVDWTEQWRPYGVPPAAARTGISTYTNNLYAYTLVHAARLVSALGRPHLAAEYLSRAAAVVRAVRTHCFDGTFFTDGLYRPCDGPACGYSVHNQVWAVLSGAAEGAAGREALRRSLADGGRFVQPSVSASFYTLRALSAAGGGLYEEAFEGFWEPWQLQLQKGLTTWEEDAVSQRSDCHAWGCAPLYEFMAEVAGVTPAEPGWAAVRVEPRLALYPEFSAVVPLKMAEGASTGLVRVSWARASDGRTAVSVRVEGKDRGALVPVYVKLPALPVQMLDRSNAAKFVV